MLSPSGIDTADIVTSAKYLLSLGWYTNEDFNIHAHANPTNVINRLPILNHTEILNVYYVSTNIHVSMNICICMHKCSFAYVVKWLTYWQPIALIGRAFKVFIAILICKRTS